MIGNSSRVARRLGGHWLTIQERAQAHAGTIPLEGLRRPAYVNAVLFDLDPAAVDEVLALLHRRGIVWVRRPRGTVHVFSARPPSISLPKDGTVAALEELCSRVAAHMLAIGRAENARRAARELGDADEAAKSADEAAMHADRAMAILRAHGVRRVPLAVIREALPVAFSEAAVAALTRREPRLASDGKADDLDVIAPPSRPTRLPAGLSDDEKVLSHVRRAGARGLTRSDLMGAIRPKPSAAALSAIVGRLEAAGRLSALDGGKPAAGRGLRYVAALAA